MILWSLSHGVKKSCRSDSDNNKRLTKTLRICHEFMSYLCAMCSSRMSLRNWGFCDLSVSNKFELDKLHIFEKLGYHTIAINTYIEEQSDEPKKKKKKGEIKEKKDFVSEPAVIPEEIKNSCKLNILNRVTIEFSDSGIAHKMNQSENLKKYDIIAVIPKTLQAFQYACGTMDIDIITFEPEGRIPFKVQRKLYRQAVERGIFFELMYSPAIRDSTARKNIISNSHVYHAVGKSKNIIITSAAEKQMFARTVQDVINLAFIFGLNSKDSLQVVRNNARRLILKADSRKRGKHYMTVDIVNETDNKMTSD